jgi:hypothetical protein
MSNAVFPTFPGLDIAVKRSAVYATKIQTSSSGKELRASFQSTPRYHYELRMNFLRQAAFNTIVDEVATLKAFFDMMLGAWDSFFFTDPVDGVQRRVRFEQDNMDLEQLVVGAWDGQTIKLVSVK